MDKYYKIKGYEDYYITKSGKIYSTFLKRELKYDKSSKGYCRVKLMDRRLGKFVGLFVHRLVALQFLKNPRNLPEVNHKDGNHSNNNVNNLEWCTAEYNRRHALENGLVPRGEKNPRAKLTEEQVIQIYKEWESCKNKCTIAKKFNVSDALIGEIVRGIRWSKVYERYYGFKSSHKKGKRKRLTLSDIKKILYKYFVELKNMVEIEKETNISNGYISTIVRGIKYPKEVNMLLLEIKEELDNQQPNLEVTGEVQRL